MIKLQKMVVNEDNTLINSMLTAISGSLAASVLSVATIILAALTGWMIAWCFPITFAVFMAKVGLAEYALWQLTAVVAFLALCLKTFR